MTIYVHRFTQFAYNNNNLQWFQINFHILPELCKTLQTVKCSLIS